MSYFLIVEDEAVSQLVLERMLQNMAMTPVLKASSVEEAKQLIAAYPVSLAFLDIMLEDHADGIELAQWLRKHHNDIPFIYASANSDAATYNRAMQTQPLAFLNKPYNMGALSQALQGIERRNVA